MKTQYGHNNHGRFDKARNNSQGDGGESSCFFRHPYRRLIMAGLLLMTVLLWTAAEQGQAEQEKDSKEQTAQTESAEKDSKTTEKPNKPDEEIRPEDILNIDSFVSAEEAKLIELIQAYAEAMSQDPESAVTKELSRKLDESRERMQKLFENDPRANLNKLPSARTAPRPSIGSLPSRKATKTAKKPNGLPHVESAQTKKAVPKTEKVGPENKAVENDPASKATEEKIEIKLENDYVKIKVAKDIIDINMLLKAVGTALELNFIYPDGAVPTGKVRLQQYGKIHKREMLPLLESVLAFSGYSMVREDPYIRIVKRADVHKKTLIFTPGAVGPGDTPEDSVVIRKYELKHATFVDVKKTLANFVPDASVITTIPKTNCLLITEYARRIPRIIEIIKLVDVPGLQRKMEIMACQHLTTMEARSQVEMLLKALNAQQVSVTGAIPLAPRSAAEPPARGRRPQPKPPTQRTSPPPASTTTKADKVTILEDKRNVRLLVIGTDEQIGQVRHLLSMFDVPVGGPEIKLVPLKVEYLGSGEVITQISSLIKALNSQGASSATPASIRPTPPVKGKTPPRSTKTISRSAAPTKTAPSVAYMQADERTNRILTVGSQEQIDQVKDMLKLLDVARGGPEIKLTPIKVKYVLAQDISERISELIKAINEEISEGASKKSTRTPAARPPKSPKAPAPKIRTAARSQSGSRLAGALGPYIQVDARTNRILVVGSEEQTNQVKELMEMLDMPVGGREIKLETLEVQYILAGEASSSIGDLITALNEQMAASAIPVGVTPPSEAVKTSKPTTTKRTPARTPTKSRATTTQAGTVTTKVGQLGPYMLAEERTNRILVVGSVEQIGQVKDLLSLLDVPVPGAEIKLVPMVPKFLHAGKLAEQISELILALTEQEQEQEIGQTGTTAKSGMEPTRTTRTPSRLPTLRRATATEQTQFIKTSSTGPILVPDVRTNRLFAIGNDEQIEQVKELMVLLDVDIDLKLVPIQIKHVLAPDIAEQISSLITALTEQDSSESTSSASRSRTVGARSQTGLRDSRSARGDYSRRRGSVSSYFVETGDGGPLLLPDDRTNRLLVVATQKQLDMINELLPLLDVPPSEYDRMKLEIFQPEYVEAADVMKILDELAITKKDRSEMRPRERARTSDRSLSPTTEQPRMTEEGQIIPGLEEPEIRTAIHEITNRIFVYATEYQLRDIKEIMKHIDMDPNEHLGRIQVYPLENRDPEIVAGMLKELLESERTYTKEGTETVTSIPGREGAPIIVTLADIHAVAVRGSTRQHEEIKNIIKILDKRLAQVLVEAIMVRVSSSDALDLGVGLQNKWAVTDKTISGVSPFGLGAALSDGIVRGVGGTVAFFDDDLVFATLEALQAQGNSKVVSKPRILVNDNNSTTITSERQEPTTKTTIPAGSDTPITEFGDYVSAGTTLTFTPHISEGNFLQLEIDLTVDSFDAKASPGVPPPKSVNNLNTIVNVPHGKTIVLGGLTSVSDAVSVNKIPLLGDIPLIGAAFRSVSRTQSEAVLYVFVRAYIVRSDTEATRDFSDLDEMSEFDRQRLDRTEQGYKKQPIIPGIPEKEREKRSALDDWYSVN
jgi:type II secretory pathway component GspD/PulD (secretin)